MATQYVLQDRTLATKWAVKITDAQLFFESTSDASESEPIFEDNTNAGTYWKLFISDGEIAIESTVTVQDDNVTLTDTSINILYRFVASNGEFGYEEVIEVSKEIYRVIKSNAPVKRVVKVDTILSIRIIKV